LERRLISTTRDCAARLVPTGDPVTIPGNTFVTLTQSLGGTYTVIFNGNMARIDSEDADVLGFEPERLTFSPPADGTISESQVREALASVFDPEIPVNVADLGLIYDVQIDKASGKVSVLMTLTAPGCGMGDVLVADVKRRVSQVPFVTAVDVDLVFDPPWSREMMSEEAQLELGLF
jgi:probable FeS assembly SUF system protein SufT